MVINSKLLLERKKELNCPDEVLAIKIGDISTYTIWSLLNVKNHNAKLETLQKVANFLGIELVDFLNEESKKEYRLGKEW